MGLQGKVQNSLRAVEVLSLPQREMERETLFEWLLMRGVYLHDSCRELALSKRYREVCERCQGRVVNTILRVVQGVSGKPLVLHSTPPAGALQSCHDAFKRMEFNDMCWTCIEQILPIMRGVLKGEAE